MSQFRLTSTRRLTRFAAAALPILAVAFAAPAHAQAACSSSASLAQVTARQSTACWRPFAGSSPFNQVLPANPQLAPDNSAVAQHMSQYGWFMGGSSSGFDLGLDGSRPIYFASPSDPTMTIHCTSAYGQGSCQGTNGVDINGMQINVPAGAQPDSNGDAHMTVIETATGMEYDFWTTSISGSTITSATGSVTNVNSSDGTGSGGDAANFALTAGLLRPSELASGQINHALVLGVPCTGTSYTYPANGPYGQACGQYWNEQATTAPQLGQRYYLNMTAAQIAASGAPAWEQTIMTALANYGAYIEDTQGSWHNEGMYIMTEDATSWTSLGQANPWNAVAAQYGQPGASTLTSNVPIPVSDLDLVNTCVTQALCLPPPVSVPSPVSTTAPSSTGSPTSTGSTPVTPIHLGHSRRSGFRTGVNGTISYRPSRHHHHQSSVQKLDRHGRRHGSSHHHAHTAHHRTRHHHRRHH